MQGPSSLGLLAWGPRRSRPRAREDALAWCDAILGRGWECRIVARKADVRGDSSARERKLCRTPGQPCPSRGRCARSRGRSPCARRTSRSAAHAGALDGDHRCARAHARRDGPGAAIHGSTSTYFASDGTLYSGSGTGPSRSSDNGKTWMRSGDGLSPGGVTYGIIGDGSALYSMVDNAPHRNRS